MTRIGVVLSLAMVGVLAGCASATDDAAPAPTPSTSSPTPTPSAPPTKPELSELVLSPDGLGPLLIGAAPQATDPAIDAAVFDPDYCADYPDVAEPGHWVPNYPDVNGVKPFGVSVHQGAVSRLDVYGDDISTSVGIHLGSSHDELLAAYPGGFTETLDLDDVVVYVLVGTQGRMSFEVATANGDYAWEQERIDTVILMRTEEVDARTRSIAFNDDRIGFCELM